MMLLPAPPPIKPMLAKRVDALPQGEDWIYEPKWDGFRVLVFRDGDETLLQSRDLKPLGRYFPELTAALQQLPARCAVDGEIVIAGANGLDFEALLQRIHPAASRVQKLAAQTPASLVLWDLLCVGEEDLRGTAFFERRKRLEASIGHANPPLYLTPATDDRNIAADWFVRFEGAGLDGVMAKRTTDVYTPAKRIMLKVKHKRTADCVVGGFRWHKKGPGTMVGSLMLGIYDTDGALHHVGVAASFKDARRRELVQELAPLRLEEGAAHPWTDFARAEPGRRVPRASRWSRDKDLRFVPLRPERVVEVSYDHMQGRRFRHTTHLVRWRPDKDPQSCDYAQLEVTQPYELAQIFGAHQGDS